jgi:hypothetical protein
MQHDTSPHEVEVGGRKYKAQTASAVLCYSRMLFFQINPTFQRFDCKVFLTDAVRYMCRWRRKTGPFWRVRRDQWCGYAMAADKHVER